MHDINLYIRKSADNISSLTMASLKEDVIIKLFPLTEALNITIHKKRMNQGRIELINGRSITMNDCRRVVKDDSFSRIILG